MCDVSWRFIQTSRYTGPVCELGPFDTDVCFIKATCFGSFTE
jgi:hypothetical protein